MWLKINSLNDAAELSCGNNFGPYEKPFRIGLGSISHEAANVRQCLNALARWGVAPDEAALPGILRALAVAGYQLYYSLFDGLTDADRAMAAEIRQWMAEQFETDNTLSISADSRLHIPWGLVCERDFQGADGAFDTMEAFADMWCLKYSLSATLTGFLQPKRLERQSTRRRLLSMLNPEVVQSIDQSIRAEFDKVTDQPIGPANTLSAVNERIAKAGKGDTVLHFFGHQSDGELDMGANNRMNVTRFKILLEELIRQSGGPDESKGLVIMSACDGAHGDSDYAFVSAADRRGMSGLISTESAVPRDYAARFAISFLRQLESGVSVGEAMLKIRKDKKMWPLSLLYGCYAQPGYKFVPAAAG